jgi:hypothetical protein
MRAEKEKKFKELQTKRGTQEYEEWFLNYKPNAESDKKKLKTTVLKNVKTINSNSISNRKTSKNQKMKTTKTIKKRRKNKSNKKRKGLFHF